MGATVRFHLGAGDKYWPGYINVDLYGDQDVIYDCRRMHAFETDYADEIHAIHYVEHVSRLSLENMLCEWHRVLKPGGRVAIEVPCLDKIAKMIVAGEKNLRLTLLGLFGDPRDQKPDMMHQWCYSGAELCEALSQCGFKDMKVMEPHYHIPMRDMRVEAVKP